MLDRNLFYFTRSATTCPLEFSLYGTVHASRIHFSSGGVRARVFANASISRKGKPITCAGKKDEGALCMYVCEDLSVALKRTESLSIVLAKLDPLLCSNGNINIAEGRALLRNFDAFYRDIRYASTAGDFLAKKLRRNGATENSPVSTMVPLFHFSFFLLYSDLSPLYCSQM